MMCELSSRLGVHRPRTKFLDVQKANLTYRKQRRHSRSQTRKITRRLLDLLGKILKEIREIERGKARTKRTEIRYIFFGIHTANVVQLADRIEQRSSFAAA